MPDEGGWRGPRKATGGVERAFKDATDGFRNADLMGADETEALAICWIALAFSRSAVLALPVDGKGSDKGSDVLSCDVC